MPRVMTLLTVLLIALAFCASAWAQNVGPEAQKHYDAGMAAKKAKNFDEAIFQFRLALELEPEYLDANWALAWTYASLEDKRKELAVEYFQKVIDLAPGTEKARQAEEAIKRLRGEQPKPQPAAGPAQPAEPPAQPQPPERPPAVPQPEQPAAEEGPPCEMNPAPRVFRTQEPPAEARAGDIWVCPADGAQMVFIPAGEFLYGPQQDIATTEAYWIDRTEVTVGQFARFAQATNRPAVGEGRDPSEPVVQVTHEDARAYARWAGKRLPTEQEWEKAARGLDGRSYPWGNEWNPARCVTVETNGGKPRAVGSVPEGASPWGMLDMAGNVWEWTDSPWEPGAQTMVIRGGSCGVAAGNGAFFTTFWRGASEPDKAAANGGFRCVISAARRAQPAAAAPQPAAPQPQAIPATAENLVGTWQLRAERKLGGEWQGIPGGAQVLQIGADGTFTHAMPAAGGGQRNVTGTWQLQGNQLTFTWTTNVLPDGTQREFRPPRVYQNQAELYEGGQTLVTTFPEDNVQQAWQKQ